jgi:farnesyl-diphosphate farnesyltransferase
VQITVRTPPSLDDLLARTSRTFALTIPRLPEPARCEVTVAYLLFRVADTLEDAERWPSRQKREALGDLAGLLREPSTRAAVALASSWEHDPPCDHPGEGMADFVAREREGGLELRDLDDLRAYCYAVAGIVGELLTELFLEHLSASPGLGPLLRPDAVRFGEGLQLVNILKDAAADRRLGRRYLPGGCRPEQILALARSDLDAAARYGSRLDEAGAPQGFVGFVALPVLLARATLDRVEQGGAGAKLTRPEVARIIQDLERALAERRVPALLMRT